MMKAEISLLIEAMEIDLEMDLSANRMVTGETMENFPVLHRHKVDTSHKIIHTANQQVINLTILPSADLTIDLRLVLHPRNKNVHKTIARHPLILFDSPEPTIPLMNCQTSVR